MRIRSTHRPALERLEGRDVPAVTIQFDYSFDTSGFFNDPARRAVLQQAAADLGVHLDGSLAAIVPGGGNDWTETFLDPSTGRMTSRADPVVAANTVVVYVGARDLPGAAVGITGFGQALASGSPAWRNFVETRGPAGTTLWGASTAFDSRTNWYFGASADGIGPGQIDFYSVATHELGHALGIGTAQQWFAQVSGRTFVGPSAEAVFGGPVPLAADGGHWADGLTIGGQPVSLDPTVRSGVRVTFSALDFAALRDLGWSVDGSATTLPPTFDGPVFTPPWVRATSPPVVLSGAGTAQAFTLASSGELVAGSPVLTPFPGFGGVVRSAVGDFNGDGTPDYAFGTGSGVAATVRVLNGRTGADLIGPTGVLGGFTGGVYLAAGDVDADGRDELAVSADAGGGTRVTVFRVAGGTLMPLADFFAFGDPGFRGGSRIALGDVNHDGAADLIVGAGLGGGPRVAVYNGTSLPTGVPVSLVPDFFALDPALRSGVFVTAADVDGDGFADVAYSTGTTGGPRVRVVGGAVLTANPGQDAYFLPAVADFFALDPADRSGLRVAGRDLNGDGKAELVVASGSANDQQVRVVTLADMTSPSGPSAPIQFPFGGSAATDGIYVG
jgi:hypothetical protein